jgi:hypothetical protein
MSDDWMKREVERKISENKGTLRSLNNDNDPQGGQRVLLQRKLYNQEQLLRIVESHILRAKARKALIPVPGPYEQPTWWVTIKKTAVLSQNTP